MIKYKKKAAHIHPGFTYLFEWADSVTFEGVYLRRNTQNPKVFLFKTIQKDECAPVFTPVDETLEECVWVNESSWDGLIEISEVNKPDFVKPQFDKKENFSAALVYDSLPMHGLDCCPKCGKEGKKVRMAYICDVHGIYGGI